MLIYCRCHMYFTLFFFYYNLIFILQFPPPALVSLPEVRGEMLRVGDSKHSKGREGTALGLRGLPGGTAGTPRAERPLPTPKIHRFGSAEEKSWKKGLEREWSPRGPLSHRPERKGFLQESHRKIPWKPRKSMEIMMKVLTLSAPVSRRSQPGPAGRSRGQRGGSGLNWGEKFNWDKETLIVGRKCGWRGI